MTILYKKGQDNIESLKEIFENLNNKYFGKFFSPFKFSNDEIIIISWKFLGGPRTPGLESSKTKLKNILEISYSKSFKQIQINLIDNIVFIIHTTLD